MVEQVEDFLLLRCKVVEVDIGHCCIRPFLVGHPRGAMVTKVVDGHHGVVMPCVPALDIYDVFDPAVGLTSRLIGELLLDDNEEDTVRVLPSTLRPP